MDIKIIIDLGNLADWFSGIGTIVTASVALWLAAKDNRPKLSISVLESNPEGIASQSERNIYHIVVQNVRIKRVYIRYIGFQYRKGFKFKDLVREGERNKPFIDSIEFNETKTYEREISVVGFNRLTNDNTKHLYLVIEDVNGKKYRTRFKPR